MDSLSFDLSRTVQQAYSASLQLAQLKGRDRNYALQVMLKLLKEQQNLILEANTVDLETSREMAVSETVLGWLKLTPERLQAATQILQQLAEISDPLERITTSSYQVDQCQTYCQQVPLGVVALIYEAFPELAIIAAGLCIKTGNSLLLKGSSEAIQSNSAVAQVLQAVTEDAGLPKGCLESLPSDQGGLVKDLVSQDKYVNLVIPYGRPSLVQQVVRQSTAPVLRSAMGNCYLYWSSSASLELVRFIIIDSYQSEPDPVNAVEKVLIRRDQNYSSLTLLWQSLKEKGFEIRGDAELVAQFPDLRLAEDAEWRQPYLSKVVAFKVVDSLKSAISWINTYSSGHADCLVTESYRDSRLFAQEVNSASTYINASPRFSRNMGRGRDSVFLGMSNQKGYRRGLIGLAALTTTRHVVQGNK